MCLLVMTYNFFLPALLGCDFPLRQQAPVGRASKFCPRCREEKGASGFGRLSSSPDGLARLCKLCRKSVAAEFRSKNIERERAKAREYRRANIDKIRAADRARRPRKPKREKIDDGARKCARCDSRKPIAEMAKGNSGVCLRCAAIQQRELRQKNLHARRASERSRYARRRGDILRIRRDWRAANHGRHRATQNAWRNKKMAEDAAFRIGCYLRNRMNGAIRRAQAGTTQTIKNLGCSTPDLLVFLERQFETGMSWDNWSLEGWHIDHIKPLACFDLSDLEELKEASHFRNLRPLWAAQNIGESDAFDEARQKMYAERLAMYPKEKPPA